ncbi:MAG: hypothetical protein ABMA64_21650 [Myxococcota bacterium]
MSLTDPELDLLLEMLEEDPSDDVLQQVGTELIRRARWRDAARVLGRASEAGVLAPQVAVLLARANLELGCDAEVLVALRGLPRDPVGHPERARLEILALERTGRAEEARVAGRRFVEVDPHDVVVNAVLDRLSAPPPEPHGRGADPFYTVERAERYVEVGRSDRAVRVYRRILLANPADASVQNRMRQLIAAPPDIEDDLSAELTDPRLVPTDADTAPGLAEPIHMPPTQLTPPGVDRELVPTDLPAAQRSYRPAMPPPSPLGAALGALPDEEGPTQRFDVEAVLRGVAAAGHYEEEDTQVDLTATPGDDGQGR